MRHSRLRGEDHAVSQAAVSGYPGLSCENHVVPDDRRACKADLRAEQCVLPHARAVANLHKVVDLRSAANLRGADGGAVDTGIGLHVHAIAEAYRAGLGNLLPLTSVVFRESETVRADDGPVFEGHMIAQDAVFAHHRVGMRKQVAAGGDPWIQDNMRQQRGVRS